MGIRIGLARAGLAGLVWGIAFGGPFTMSVRQFGPGQPSDWSLLHFLMMLLFVALGYAPVGMILSVIYAALLGAWEQWKRPSNAAFLAVSVFLSALCSAPLAFWSSLDTHVYYPDAGFTGGAANGRDGLCGGSAGRLCGGPMPAADGK